MLKEILKDLFCTIVFLIFLLTAYSVVAAVKVGKETDKLVTQQTYKAIDQYRAEMKWRWEHNGDF